MALGQSASQGQQCRQFSTFRLHDAFGTALEFRDCVTAGFSQECDETRSNAVHPHMTNQKGELPSRPIASICTQRLGEKDKTTEAFPKLLPMRRVV